MINTPIHEPHRDVARVLAALLSYPDAPLRAVLPELGVAWLRDSVLPAEHRDAVFALIVELQRGDPLEMEANYVDTFDRGRRTSLHLFEHVHGDSRDRGPAMIDLQQTYAQEGMWLAPGELPDYLPVVLEFASTQPYEVAREFLAEMAHLLQSIHAALARQQSPYAAAVAAAIDLAGEAVQRVDTVPEAPADMSLEEQWAEPPVFDGCSGAGQNTAPRVQPIQIVSRDTALPRGSKEAMV